MDPSTVADVVSNTAHTVVQQSTSALSVAAEELAKQANALGQLANAKDPIAWIAGEEDDDPEMRTLEGDRPEPIVAVPVAALHPWGSSFGDQVTSANLYAATWRSSEPLSEEAIERRKKPPFEVDIDLNGKVILWTGDLCSVDVDALLAPTAAGFTSGASTVFPRIARYGGKDLRLELKHLDACRSGEARITKAYGLPCRWLVLTVGPKYKDKYHVAAENTLNSCYREAMQLLAENGLRSIAIPCNWYAKGYPPEEQAHVALRSVRRCLENLRQSIDTVIVVASSAHEVEFYESLMPLYFPRNQAEANAGREALPDSCWNKWGEVNVEERRIRISPLIRTEDADSDDDSSMFDRERPSLWSATEDDDRSFLDARADADDVARRRLEGTMIEAEDTSTMRAACLRYLRRARDLKAEPESSRFVYGAGQDQFQRHVVVLLGARLPSLGVRDERTLPLFVKELEALRDSKFVLLYVHSNVSGLDTSCLEVLQEMLAVISAKYRGFLEQLIVLHPGLWFRAAFAFGRAVSDMAALIWNETVYAESLDMLSRYLPLERLQLPEYVRAADCG